MKKEEKQKGRRERREGEGKEKGEWEGGKEGERSIFCKSLPWSLFILFLA
jgi:hypothetical protein